MSISFAPLEGLVDEAVPAGATEADMEQLHEVLESILEQQAEVGVCLCL